MKKTFRAPLRPSTRSTNQILKFKMAPWRSKVAFAVLSLGFMALVCKAVYIQFVSQEFLQQEADSRFTKVQTLQATRGKILDRNGSVLASSLPAKAIGIYPPGFKPTEEQSAQLAKLLDMPVKELRRRVDHAGKQFFYLQRQVDPQVSDKIQAMRLAGIDIQREYKRLYPIGDASAQIVGFTNTDDIGVDGVEYAFQKTLAGQPGQRRVVHNRLGHLIDEDASAVMPPAAGHDLQLAIDTRIQDLAFSAVKEAVTQHRAKAGAVL